MWIPQVTEQRLQLVGFPNFDEPAMFFANQVVDVVYCPAFVAPRSAFVIADNLYGTFERLQCVKSNITTLVVMAIERFFDVCVDVLPFGIANKLPEWLMNL